MLSKDLIIKEFFASLLKRPYEPAVNDVIIDNVVRLALTKRYQYHITEEEFVTIGDELVEAGYFKWNENGKLALDEGGLLYLSKK
jgi:hypothetical protein